VLLTETLLDERLEAVDPFDEDLVGDVVGH
jgi:hypothetical protein